MGKKKGGSPHPGVVPFDRKLPSGKIGKYAYYIEPSTGKRMDVSFTKKKLTNPRQRLAWMKKKSVELRDERRRLEMGGVPTSLMKLEDALDDYERRHADLSKNTLRIYGVSLRWFRQWAEQAGITETVQVTRTALGDFRAWLIAQPSPRNPEKPRSSRTLKTYLQSVRIVLNDLRKIGLLPKLLDHTALEEVLPDVPQHHSRPTFLRSPQLKKLLKAALRHDSETYALTRAEQRPARRRGMTPRCAPIAPFTLFVLLSGCRFGEVAGLPWADVYLEDGQIHITAGRSKTRAERMVSLRVSPALSELLSTLKLRSAGVPYVFGGPWPLPRSQVESARARLISKFGAPGFTWQELRRTTGTYLACAPGIYGGASLHMTARQLGHDVRVCERYYAGVLTDIPVGAQDLEGAMGVHELAKSIAREPPHSRDSAVATEA